MLYRICSCEVSSSCITFIPSFVNIGRHLRSLRGHRQHCELRSVCFSCLGNAVKWIILYLTLNNYLHNEVGDWSMVQLILIVSARVKIVLYWFDLEWANRNVRWHGFILVTGSVIDLWLAWVAAGYNCGHCCEIDQGTDDMQGSSREGVALRDCIPDSTSNIQWKWRKMAWFIVARRWSGGVLALDCFVT